MAQPPPKKAKTEEGDAEMKEETLAEVEQDAVALKGKPIDGPVTFHVPDTTLNLLPSTEGNLLASLTDGGFQHLCAAGRASVGIKSGRYSFEVKLVEFITPFEHRGPGGNLGMKQYLRLGFSLANSSLFLGETEDSVCFAGEGFFIYNKQKTSLGQRFVRDTVLTVVLNLDSSSPNCNTVSLFKDGVRASKPQPLPESFKGQALYPAVSFKNMVVHTNFGPEPLAPLPFKCHMVGKASTADAVVAKAPSAKDRAKVVFPVGLPDCGIFDWADNFLATNPNYVELSDRAILDWAEKSGVMRPKGYGIHARKSLDQPDMEFNLVALDDLSVQKLLKVVAPIQKRNYLIMELKGNLTASDRKAYLEIFPSSEFIKEAHVMVGDVPADFKKKQQEMMLADKQAASDKAFAAEKLIEKRRKELEKKKKEAERMRKKAEKEKAKKKAEEEKAKKKAEAEAKGETVPEEEEKAEEEAEEEEKEEEEPESNEQPPKVELDAEEKKLTFRKMPVPDLKDYVMNTSFTNFSIPEKAEGFDDIQMLWSKTKGQEHLKKWILDKKLVTRIEDIVPSPAFRELNDKWTKAMSLWKAKEKEYRDRLTKRANAKAQAAAAKRAAEVKKAKAAEKAESEEKKEGEEKPMEVEESKEDEVDEQEEAESKINFAELDIFGIEDVTDVGAGIPLFKDFKPEDWTLAALRVELHLLIKFFKMDSKDPDRTAIHVDHLGFYYNKYFKKNLNPRHYGKEDMPALLGLLRDTIFLSDKVVQTLLPEDFETFSMFAKLAEEDRRYRGLQIDLGREEAKLKFNVPWDNWNKGGGSYKGGGGGTNWQNNSNKGGGKAWNAWEKNDKGYGSNKAGGAAGKGFGKESAFSTGKGQPFVGQQKRPWGK